MKVREDHILKVLAAKHKEKDSFFTHVKNGPSQTVRGGELAIIDAVAIAKSWTRPVIRGYEVKVERSDFLRDTKFHKYFDMCHEFSFVCPTKLIDKSEVPEQAGLIYYNPEKQSLYTAKKAVYREIPMPVDMLWYIIISQAKSDRHPFFSSQRDMLEAWVSDKEDRVKLGYEVSAKLRMQLEGVPNLQRDLKWQKEHAEERQGVIDSINEVLKPYGVRIYNRWDHGGIRQLRDLLQRGGTVDLNSVTQQAERLFNELDTLNRLQEHVEESVR